MTKTITVEALAAVLHAEKGPNHARRNPVLGVSPDVCDLDAKIIFAALPAAADPLREALEHIAALSSNWKSNSEASVLYAMTLIENEARAVLAATKGAGDE